MAYDPTKTTVRQRILANIVSTLSGINTPAYATKLSAQQVKLWDGNLVKANLSPFVVVMPLVEERSDAADPLIEVSMKLVLRIAAKGIEAQTQLEKLLADISVALQADPYRGTFDTGFDTRNNARTTAVLSCQVFDPVEGQPLAEAFMDVLVEYGHLRTDPTTPY